MSHRIDEIQQELAPLRAALLSHPLYRSIHSLDSLRVFMEYHIFAVWDFMSLLKFLQQHLTCVDVPWIPQKCSPGTRLINEIVLAEESDDDGNGEFASHFDLYHRSMQRAGASTDRIDSFIARLRAGDTIDVALEADRIPDAVREFVTSTFQLVQSGNVVAVAAGFAFGREDLLPDLFRRIVDELNLGSGGRLETFCYYLDRHIELDGDQHGPMAEQLLCALCGDDDQKWSIAESAAVEALRARLQLWNSILDSLPVTPSSESLRLADSRA